MTATRLDLDEPRGFAGLLRETFRLYGRHALLFLGVTLLVIVPAELLLHGLWGDVLREGTNAESVFLPSVVSALLTAPLVLAAHVRIVERLGEGATPTVGGALRDAARWAPVALATVCLWLLGFVLGLALLIVPGVYLFVRLYFGTAAAIVEGRGPVAAITSTGELVRGQWWRAFSYVFGVIALTVAVSALGSVVIGPAAQDAAGPAAYFVVVHLLVDPLTFSFESLFGTLAFFELRRRRAAAPG